MKTDREKLTTLLNDFVCTLASCDKPTCNECIADYLISKGVTIPVRCGECIYMEEAYEKNGFLICPASGMEIMNTDFCSYGERKKE